MVVMVVDAQLANNLNKCNGKLKITLKHFSFIIFNLTFHAMQNIFRSETKPPAIILLDRKQFSSYIFLLFYPAVRFRFTYFQWLEGAPQLLYKFIEQTMQPGPSVSLKCRPSPYLSFNQTIH